MKTEYKRDMNHSFMILSEMKPVDTSSYQTRMLIGNVIPGLLKCRLQAVDGTTLFYYEITSRQPLSSLYESKKLSIDELQLILNGFVQTMEEMAEFLLNPENLIISPEYIYVDVEKKRLYFCYLPGYERAVQEQFQAFTEYILPRLNHEDNCAVMLGYGVYRRALDDSFHLEYIKEELYRAGTGNERLRDRTSISKKETEVSDEIKEEIPEIPADSSVLWTEEKEDKKTIENDRKIWARQWAGCVGAAAFILGMVICKAFGYLPWLTAEGMIGAGIVLLGAGSLLGLLLGKEKNRKASYNIDSNRESESRSETEEMEQLFTDQEKTEEQPPAGEVGETELLSSKVQPGPASLVSKEPGALATIYLTDEITVVGKLETAADAVIPVPTVSRIHAKIRKREDDYYLCDLNSRNGTSVNGRMLKNGEEYCLQDEDEVDFALARYIFLK